MIAEKSSPPCPAKPMDFEELEKYWAVQDKWRLIAWGLKQKQSLVFRLHFLTVTEHLKDRFRIILGRFLSRRAQREFEQMEQLIKNFDLGSLDPKDSKQSKIGNLNKSNINKVDINNFKLDVI